MACTRPLLQKFEAGYTAGAKAINPNIKVQVKYLTQPPDFSGFNDPAKGKTAAQGMFDAAAPTSSTHAAGGSGSGVFKAAKAAGKLAIGVDSDQYLTASADVKDVILTSMLKRVDVAVYDFIKSAVDGSPLTGVQTFDLKKDGVGYSTSNPAVQPYTAKADAAASSRSSPARSRFPTDAVTDRPRSCSTGPGPDAIASGPGPFRRRAVPPDAREEAGHQHPTTQSAAAPAVELRGITKRFPGVVANHDIDLAVRRGHRARHRRRERRRQVDADEDPLRHAQAGRGHDRHRRRAGGHCTRPADAIARGIGMVHQHFMLADNLTVLENIVLGQRARRRAAGSTSRPPARRIDEIGRPATASTSTRTPCVEDLGVGERQRVEILKVLYRGARILILDEPTAVLVPQEVDELFDTLRELKAEGLTIIFISHKLDEVLSVADEITVIRRGTTVATVDPADGHRPAARRADGRQRAALAGDRASPRSPTSPVLDGRAA